MKSICALTAALLLCLPFGFSQTPLAEILNSGKRFSRIVTEAEAYFTQKHPDLKPSERCEGEHRDGEFVKYMRWKSYWKDHLNPNGTLGDPSTYYRQGRPNNRTLGLYCDIAWNNISIPRNLGGQIGVGRTTSVAFHPTNPQTFWVSTAIGGIWKTTNGGQTYVPIGDHMPTLAVSVVLVDPTNTDILYAATGDRLWYGLPGLGIYKSTDGGQNWVSTALEWPFSSNFRIYAMAMDPSDPNTIYVAGDNGFFKTTDGFATVQQINGGKFYDVKFKPGDPSVIYVTGNNFFRRSIDGGESFQQIKFIPTSGSTRLVVSPADPERVYYSIGNTLFQSFDGGTTFPDTKDIEALDNGSFGYVFMSHENANVLYGGYFNTWKSTNNGSNWQKITCFSGGNEIHVDNHFAAVNPLTPSEVYFCNDGGLYKLPENGCANCFTCFSEFIDLSGGMKISQYYDISNSQQQNTVIGGGTQDNGSFFRNSSGNWQFYASTGDGMVSAIDPSNDTYRYWEYQYGSIHRYVNGNNTCISCNISGDVSGNGAWETPYMLDPSNPTTIVAAYRRVYRSTNRGNGWITISGELADGNILDLLAIAPSNSDVIYVNDFDRLYKTSNASEGSSVTWTNKLLPVNNITGIAVDPIDENRVYVSAGGYAEGSKVFVSEDGGENWTNISGTLPNVPANVIKTIWDNNYTRAVMVGTDAGVYYLDASLGDWEEYGQLPHTSVTDIEFQYASQLVRIGTHGRSVFEAPLPLNECLSDTPPDSDQDGVCDAFDICDGGDDNIDLDADGVPDFCETYCMALGSPGTGADWINYVELNTIANSSNQTPYSDFTDIITDLKQGLSYDLQIGLNFSFDFDVAYAWIDYNQNREFEDEERIMMSGFDDQHQSIGLVEVPEDALLGPTVLRVRNIYQDFQLPNPCDNYFGEVEDYTVNIVEGETNTDSPKDSSFSIALSPNPASTIFRISPSGLPHSQLQLRLLNAHGQVVLSQQQQALSGTPIEVNVQHLPQGVYWVLAIAGEKSTVERMIIQR